MAPPRSRVALWGGFGVLIAATVAVSVSFSNAPGSTKSAAGRVHPTYPFRSLEECAGQRYLTEAEIYESERLLQAYIDGIDTVPPDTGYGDLEAINRASEDDSDEPPFVPGPDYRPDDDYSPEYYAAIDPDGDHCRNPVPDELMMVDGLSLGPGSTTTIDPSTTSTTLSSTTTSTTLAPCAFTGFFSPVDNNPVVNVVKAGAAVPVKFGFCQSGTLAIFTAGSPASLPHTCGTEATDDIESTVAVSTSGLTFDPASSRYQYNWKTDNAWAGQCRTLSLVFTNGTRKTAEFRFR